MRLLLVSAVLLAACKTEKPLPGPVTADAAAIEPAYETMKEREARKLRGDLRGRRAFPCGADADGDIELAIASDVAGSCPAPGEKRLGAVLHEEGFVQRGRNLRDEAFPESRSIEQFLEKEEAGSCVLTIVVTSPQVKMKHRYELRVKDGVVDGTSFYSDPRVPETCGHGFKWKGTRTLR